MNKKAKTILCCMLSSVFLLTGCSVSDLQNSYNEFRNSLTPKESYEKDPSSSMLVVKDEDSLYSEPMEKNVIYLTVGRDSDGTPEHTWTEINDHSLSWYEENDLDLYETNALLQFGDEQGAIPGTFGYDNLSANCTVRLTGEKASERQQKSYRIKIKSGSGNVAGIKTIILSKGFGDPFRFSNKLCFDLLKDVDSCMSVRTEFVHLYVRDETEGKGKLFMDYGMYTMLETVNKRYLKNRGLDDTGELYKAVSFDFGRHPDVIKQPTDPSFDSEKFEELLEAKGSNDYSCLIEMLDAVNDENADIEKTVKKYFDEDNIYTWMAFNILTANKNVDVEDFYLYSPTGSEKFYIIPWDYDGAFREDYELMRDPDYNTGWQKGIHIFTQSVLFRRMMQNRHCTEKLSDRIDMLHESVLAPENVHEKAKVLSEEIKSRVYSMPDMTYARVSKNSYDELIELLPGQIEKNYDNFYASLLCPWPFHILEPKSMSENVIISWDESYLIDKDVTYNVEISRTWDFATKEKSSTGIKETKYNAGVLPKGQYFARVVAVSPDGETQEAYEFYNTEKKTVVHGIICFYITEDGSIIQSTFLED